MRIARTCGQDMRTKPDAVKPLVNSVPVPGGDLLPERVRLHNMRVGRDQARQGIQCGTGRRIGIFEGGEGPGFGNLDLGMHHVHGLPPLRYASRRTGRHPTLGTQCGDHASDA